MTRCCICGSTRQVSWCRVCAHYFCLAHRWFLWGWGQRTAAAVKEMLTKTPPRYCDHGGRDDD